MLSLSYIKAFFWIVTANMKYGKLTVTLLISMQMLQVIVTEIQPLSVHLLFKFG